MTKTIITIEVKKGMIYTICTNTLDIDIRVLDHDNGDTEFESVGPDGVFSDEELYKYIDNIKGLLR